VAFQDKHFENRRCGNGDYHPDKTEGGTEYHQRNNHPHRVQTDMGTQHTRRQEVGFDYLDNQENCDHKNQVDTQAVREHRGDKRRHQCQKGADIGDDTGRAAHNRDRNGERRAGQIQADAIQDGQGGADGYLSAKERTHLQVYLVHDIVEPGTVAGRYQVAHAGDERVVIAQ